MRKALGLMVGLLAGCGGGAEHVPCTGQGCIDVAGNYTVTAQSPGSGNTCKHIFYVLGSDGTAEESFEAPFTLTQSGADLTFSFLGSGVAFDWQLARPWVAGRRVILAGGLTPDNVAEAVEQVRPWGVDVASGVEASPGRKDPVKVRRFVSAAAEALSEFSAADGPA